MHIAYNACMLGNMTVFLGDWWRHNMQIARDAAIPPKNSIHFQENVQGFVARHSVSMAAIMLRDDCMCKQTRSFRQAWTEGYRLEPCFQNWAHFAGTDENGGIPIGALMECKTVQAACFFLCTARYTPKRTRRRPQKPIIREPCTDEKDKR